MTTQREVERLLDSFFAPNGDEVADWVIDAALSEIEHTPQRRVLDVPWRPNTMNPFVRLAVAAAAIVIVAGGALYLFSPGNQGVGGPTPAPSPTTTGEPNPTPIETATWLPFESARHGFTLRYPSDWTASQATEPWPFEAVGATDDTDPVFDRFVPATSSRPTVTAASSPLPNGMSEDEWIARYRQPVVDEFGATCFPPREEWERVTVGGFEGGLYTGCAYVESLTFAGGRAYVVTVFLGMGFDVDEATRELLRAFLSTMVLTPESADDRPMPAAVPSQALEWETYTSDRFQYRMDVPVGWLHSFPFDDLPDNLYPGDESQYADRWDQPVLRMPYLIVSVIDPAPESDDAWLERTVAQMISDCDASEPVEVSVAGTTGERRRMTCLRGLATEIVLFRDVDRVYSIESSGVANDTATASEILDHVLETFQFTGPA
jgi:hypothetical protein